MRNKKTHRDAFALLCGEKIGAGVSRDVFECRLNPAWVVKVEADRARWANVKEWEFWRDWQHCEAVAKWLAPVHHLSPDGRILIQSRTAPLDLKRLPKMMPDFLTDLKPSNYGRIGRRVVCHDYALTTATAKTNLKRIKWRMVDGYGKPL